MNTTVTMHRDTDKIEREDSYETRIVRVVHFGIYGTYTFVNNYVFCIRIKPTSAYEVM